MEEKIKKDVIAYIASYSDFPADSIKDEFILKNQPLYLDDIKLGFLTAALKQYLESIKPGKTLLVSELKKPGLSVKQTYAEIIKK